MNYNFTDRVRKVLAMAREEAIRLQHDYVGTEHLLLGLIREGEASHSYDHTNPEARDLICPYGGMRACPAYYDREKLE